jgi:septal ring factor EnvC (AmiA/AmiB activator)
VTFRRRALPASFAFIAAGIALQSSAAPAADARQELRELRGRIEALEKRLRQSEASRSEAVDALEASERAISDANRRLHELEAQSSEVNRRLAEVRTAAQAGEAKLHEQQRLLGEQLYRQYVGGTSTPLMLLLNGEDPNRVARLLHYLGYVARARADLIADMRRNIEQLDALARESAAKSAELAAITTDEAAQKRSLEAQQAARRKVLARIARDIGEQQREIGTLKRNEIRLTRLVEELARAISRKPGTPRLRNERVPDVATSHGPFEQLKGRLALPVRGELRSRFGSPRPEGGVTWKGLFIAARAGEPVRAIAAGRVVFADWLRGFGNLLIIDHGGAYMSLYGNAEALYKRVGDAIRGGDPVATVGNSGGNADSGLYFELRHEGRPLDPLPWVDLH